jgi:hypothetical protein
MTVEDGANRGCRDLYPEAQHFSLDALVAPARVLPRQADDQLLDVLVERGSPGSASWVGPGARDEAAVLAQQGPRLDEEAGPASPRQRAADRSQQGPIGRLQPGTWSLAAEHGELVAQDKDLKVLGGVTAGELGEELDGAAQRQVGKSWQHRGWPPRWGQRRRHGSKPRSMGTPPAHRPCLNICTLRAGRNDLGTVNGHYHG